MTIMTGEIRTCVKKYDCLRHLGNERLIITLCAYRYYHPIFLLSDRPLIINEVNRRGKHVESKENRVVSKVIE